MQPLEHARTTAAKGTGMAAAAAHQENLWDTLYRTRVLLVQQRANLSGMGEPGA